MSVVSDTLKTIKAVLLLQEDVQRLTAKVDAQGDRLRALSEGHHDLRDRVSRIEGMLDGLAMARAARREPP